MDLLSKKCVDCWFRNRRQLLTCRACKWPVGCGRIDYYFKDPALSDNPYTASDVKIDEEMFKSICMVLETCNGCLHKGVFVGNECVKCHDFSCFTANAGMLNTINKKE